MPDVRGADMHQKSPSLHIPDETTHFRTAELLLHVILLQLIPGIHGNPAGFMTGQQVFNESLTERAGAAGDEDAFAIKHENDS